MEEPGPAPKVLLADKGYDSDAIRDDLDTRGIVPVIPYRRNRLVKPPIDGFIYALRNQIERCLNNLKHSRRFATRYDKTSSSFPGSALLASRCIWIRHFVYSTWSCLEMRQPRASDGADPVLPLTKSGRFAIPHRLGASEFRIELDEFSPSCESCSAGGSFAQAVRFCPWFVTCADLMGAQCQAQVLPLLLVPSRVRLHPGGMTKALRFQGPPPLRVLLRVLLSVLCYRSAFQPTSAATMSSGWSSALSIQSFQIPGTKLR